MDVARKQCDRCGKPGDPLRFMTVRAVGDTDCRIDLCADCSAKLFQRIMRMVGQEDQERVCREILAYRKRDK